jgi:hypothetical protein
MSIVEKKEFLLHIIEDADEKLTGLSMALAKEYNTSRKEYTAEEISSFYKTRNEYLQNPESVSTVEEAHQKIRNKHRDAI